MNVNVTQITRHYFDNNMNVYVNIINRDTINSFPPNCDSTTSDIEDAGNSITVIREKLDRIKEFCEHKSISFFDLYITAIYIYISRVYQSSEIILFATANRDANASSLNTPKKIEVNKISTVNQLVTIIDQELLDYNNNTENISEEDTVENQDEPGFRINIINEQLTGTLKIDINHLGSFKNNEIVYSLLNSIDYITDEIINNFYSPINSINILSDHERYRIVKSFNNTYRNYPNNKSIPALFEDYTTECPEHIALQFQGGEYTYYELNQRANQLAHKLIELGCTEESKVGILLDRSPEFIIAVLGILKAGGVYVPLDIKAPKDRVEYIIQDCSINIILTHADYADKLSMENLSVLYANSWSDNDNTDNPNIDVLPENLSYIMYTSGSTGNPKGVMVKHKNVVRLVKNNGFLDANADTSLIMTGSLTFDAITFEIWTALLNGGKLCIVEEKELLDLPILEQRIKEYKVNTLFLTTALFHYITDKNINLFALLRYLLTGGDVLSVKHVNKIKNTYPDLALYNCYGPTENGCMSTVFKIDHEITSGSVSIGSPIGNSTVYILDNNLQPLPINVLGEICVGGDGIARGYLNNDNATKEKFVNNPFGSGLLYRTGDLGKWQQDGTITFFGRADNQIKIRGFRIELEEIEIAASAHPLIEQLCIVIIQDDQNKELCLYYTSMGINPEELRTYLQDKLPPYMVPTYLVEVDHFPLNANGKIDRNNLPKPEAVIQKRIPETQEPQTNTEKRLFNIWNQFFRLPSIGLDDDFFALGGYSLKAMQVIDAINQEFSVNLDISAIFTQPTIRLLASKIEQTPAKEISPITVLEKKDCYPMSFAQRRLFLLNQIEGNSTSYNVPIGFKLGENVSLRKLKYALYQVIKRHEAFRTTFEIRNDELVQVVHDKGIVELKIYYQEDDAKQIVDEFIKPFNLNELPLFRVGIIKSTSGEHIILFDFHHIIGDGESLQILLKDINTFYSGEEPAKLRVQYKDYMHWQAIQFESESYSQQKEYWLNKLSGELPVLNLPYDRPRPVKQRSEGDEYIFEIEKDIFDKLKIINKECNVTLYMTLIAAYSVLLSKYSGQEDILVGTPIRGRKHPDADSLIGMFINNIVIRSNPGGNISFSDYLNSVKNTVVEAFDNQDFQFEELVSLLNIPKDLGRTPIFDTIFVVQEILTKDIRFDNISTLPFDIRNKSAKYDIFFEAYPTTDIIKCVINYSTALFNSETIELLSQHFINILKNITDNIHTAIKDIDILSDSEKYLYLHEFNNTKTFIGEDETIISLFRKQAKETPENIAVVYKDCALTYRELDSLSDKLANIILSKGIKQDGLIGLMLHRSEQVFIAQLGILKSGVPYLPIDKEFPKNRIEYMLEKGNVYCIITEPALTNVVQFEGEYIFIDDIIRLNPKEDKTINPLVHPSNIAYTIFTSGSTGNPKGVQITHKAVVNFIAGITNEIDFKTHSTILCLTTVSFDIYVLESLLALCSGCKVIMAGEEEQLDSKLLNRLIIESDVEILQITPSRLQLMLIDDSYSEALSKLKIIMVGGEAFPKHLFDLLKSYPNLKIYNMYGPTETTVWSTLKDLTNAEKITIGKPIANTQIYILDKNMMLVPKGVAGDLYIGGEGLSPGYLGNEELTSKAFVPNPFVAGDTIYRTGDMAKWTSDGDIEFLGRSDFQVKVRGYRIELSEIEEKLRECEGVLECVVIVNADKLGYNRLIAYYTSSIELDVKLLRKQLSEELPDYMIPDIFVRIPAIPLTPNNKTDRKRLPNVEDIVNSQTTEVKLPENELQKQLFEIWSTVLGNDRIGIHDTFFELGGNSLSLVIMNSMIDKVYPGKVNVTDIFTHPTIARLAEFIRNGAQPQANHILLKSTGIPAQYFDNVTTQKYVEHAYSYTYTDNSKSGLARLSSSWNTNEEVLIMAITAFVLSKIFGNPFVSFYVYKDDRFYEVILDISRTNKLEELVTSIGLKFNTEGMVSYSLADIQTAKIQAGKPNLYSLFVCGNKSVDLQLFDVQFIYKDLVNEFKIENIINTSRLNTNKWQSVFSNYISVIRQIATKVS